MSAFGGKADEISTIEKAKALARLYRRGQVGPRPRLGRQHANQEGLAGLVNDFGLALTNESTGSDHFLIAQTVEEEPGARVDLAPHVLLGNIRIVRHGLGCHIVCLSPNN